MSPRFTDKGIALPRAIHRFLYHLLSFKRQWTAGRWQFAEDGAMWLGAVPVGLLTPKVVAGLLTGHQGLPDRMLPNPSPLVTNLMNKF